MKRILLSLLFVISSVLFSFAQQGVTLTVTNPTEIQRQELIAVNASELPFPAKKGIIVRDVFGIEQASQLTHDGKLLLYVHLRPNGMTDFTIQPGTPAPVASWVGGRQYPERKDDLAFENDRIGFRMYGPALQRSGEKGYGHDVWIKRTPELILDELYRHDPMLSFHWDYGKGLDCYGVGQSLGCGTPCMIRDGKIVFPWCYETYRILDKGPLRFTVQANFGAVNGITEHRLLTLDRGSNFCEAWVWYDGISQPTDIAAGLAIRASDPKPVVEGKDYVHYADPTVDPERHQFQIYSALLFPDQPVSIKQQESHALGIMKGYQSGQRFHYFFGAAWSEFDVRSQGEWQLRIDGFMQSKKQPLKVEIKK